MDTQERYGARYHTGDINLAAALMACGVHLDPLAPVRLIESEAIGRDYASFRLFDITADGLDSTGRLMSAWSKVEPLPAHHPFEIISRFVAGKPREIRHTNDLLDYAIDWLRADGINPPCSSLADIPDLCRKFPQSVESYILGFVYNRETCFKLCQQARREVHQFSKDGNRERQTLIDTRLPRWQRNELLSRLQG